MGGGRYDGIKVKCDRWEKVRDEIGREEGCDDGGVEADTS